MRLVTLAAVMLCLLMSAPYLDAATSKFAARVAELKAANQWNLVVLHTIEWTRKEPKNEVAWNELGLGYAKLKQFDDADESFRAALRLTPRNSRVWFNLGALNYAREELKSAALAFEEALRFDPKDVASMKLLADIHIRNGNYKDARALLDRVLLISPEDSEALCSSGRLANLEKRTKDLREIVAKLRPIDRMCGDELAALHARLAASDVEREAAMRQEQYRKANPIRVAVEKELSTYEAVLPALAPRSSEFDRSLRAKVLRRAEEYARNASVDSAVRRSVQELLPAPCVTKPVMTDEDYQACGATPPRR